MGKKLSHITKKYRIPNTCQVDIIVVSTALAWRVENVNVNKTEEKNFTNDVHCFVLNVKIGFFFLRLHVLSRSGM